MTSLEQVVNKVRDDLKAMYLKDRAAVWTKPFVVFITHDGPRFLECNASDEKLAGFLREHRAAYNMLGVVVGRMVAKYSKVVGPDGQPMITEKGILITGRMLQGDQTYVSITPCKEHQDLRVVQDGQRKPLPELSNVKSPDKSEAILDESGAITGWVDMEFGKEVVFDSRRGERCALDPIIQGVIETGGGTNE